ncbi:MAG: hypothetical protein JJ863_31190 [Deltaproteobacteria bacterium]|nr:hypothetical protein [Deltaproteobacteria bacterium]
MLRMVSGVHWSVEWTAFGAIRKVKNPDGVEAQYHYDALGNRRLEVTPEGHTYRFDDYEMTKDLDESIVIRAGGRVIATGARKSGEPEMTLVYNHTDDIGSARVMTNESGDVIEERVRAPYGDDYGVSWSTPITDSTVPGERGLTGHRETGKLGIVEMGGRDYAVGTKHMLSPDPIIARPLGIQGRHPYSYVWNQPRNFVDPLGLTPQGPTGVVESGEGLDSPFDVESGENLDPPPSPAPGRGPRVGADAGGGDPNPATESGPARPEGDGGERTADTTSPDIERITLILVTTGEDIPASDRRMHRRRARRVLMRVTGQPNEAGAWGPHAREVARGYSNSRVRGGMFSTSWATATIRALGDNVEIQNLIILGHGDAADGSGTVTWSSSSSLRPPDQTTDPMSAMFWDAVREHATTDGPMRVMLLTCYTGQDQSFLNSVDAFLTIEGREVSVTAYRGYYGVGFNGASVSDGTYAREVYAAPAEGGRRRGPSQSRRYMPPSTPPPSARSQ